MGQADPILTRLNAGPAVKKLVETALALSSSQDPQQRNHAYGFMESAIKELENADVSDENQPNPDKSMQGHLEHDQNEPVSKVQEEDDDDNDEKKIHEQDDDDDKNEHKIHEEELANHNQGTRTDGSEMSTENIAPYPGTGRDSTNGEKPMQDMDNTVNQWSETNGMIVPGLPPTTAENGMPPMTPGFAPDIAQELGQGMPAPPQLNNNQMMRQMQYTIDNTMKNYHNKVTVPLNERLNATIRLQKETIKKQKDAIKQLSIELRETNTNNGNLKLDLDSLKQHATAKFRETEPALGGFADANAQSQIVTGVQPVPNYQRHKIATARSEIEQMDKMLNSQKNPMYN